MWKKKKRHYFWITSKNMLPNYIRKYFEDVSGSLGVVPLHIFLEWIIHFLNKNNTE